VHAYADGGDDIPSIGGGEATGLELRVRRLVIENGEVELDHRRVPLTLDLPDFRGRLSAGAAGALAGNLAFGPGQVRFGDNPALELATGDGAAARGAPADRRGVGGCKPNGSTLRTKGSSISARAPDGESSTSKAPWISSSWIVT
jgi:hypothetical protein